MPDKVPECLPDRTPEDLPDRMPDRMSEDMPEDMPDRVPEDMPEHIAEDMPDKMPEDMSDRMPEDLPVTKRTNVMVGITRSKVILDIFGKLLLVQLIQSSLLVPSTCWGPQLSPEHARPYQWHIQLHSQWELPASLPSYQLHLHCGERDMFGFQNGWRYVLGLWYHGCGRYHRKEHFRSCKDTLHGAAICKFLFCQDQRWT